MIIFANNQFIPTNTPSISADDRGFLLGDGLFETIRVYKGNVLFLPLHWERLVRTAAILEISLPFNLIKLQDILTQLLIKNNFDTQDARIRLTITRGLSLSGLAISTDTLPTIIIKAVAYQIPPAINNVIVATLRRNELSPLAHIKSLNYLDNILALQEAQHNGADDALMFNTHGNLACSTAANVFIVKNNKLYTPPLTDGALPGIMRGQILYIAKQKNIEHAEIQIDLEQLKTCQEIFLTNSLVGIRTVHSIYGRRLHTNFTRNLQHLLQKHVQQMLERNLLSSRA